MTTAQAARLWYAKQAAALDLRALKPWVRAQIEEQIAALDRAVLHEAKRGIEP